MEQTKSRVGMSKRFNINCTLCRFILNSVCTCPLAKQKGQTVTVTMLCTKFEMTKEMRESLTTV